MLLKLRKMWRETEKNRFSTEKNGIRSSWILQPSSSNTRRRVHLNTIRNHPKDLVPTKKNNKVCPTPHFCQNQPKKNKRNMSTCFFCDEDMSWIPWIPWILDEDPRIDSGLRTLLAPRRDLLLPRSQRSFGWGSKCPASRGTKGTKWIALQHYISDSIGCHTVTTQQSMIGKCLERDEDVRHAGKTSVATRRKKNLQNVCSSMQTSYPQCLFFMYEDLHTRYTRHASILFTSWDSRDMCMTCLCENAWKQLKLHRPQRKIKTDQRERS